MLEPKTKRLLIILALVCWVATIFMQGGLSRYGFYQETVAASVSDVREGGTLALVAMLGGFRNIAANMLWLKSDEYWHQGGSGWWRMLPILRTITTLDPHFIEAWDILGWHCAWNLHSDANEADKDQWIEAGVQAYKDGIAKNPKRYELYSSLAWLYHDRLRDYRRAIPIWEQVVSFKEAPVTQLHMLAHCHEKLWEVDKAVAVWEKALKMKNGDNPVAQSAIDWWAVHRDDKTYLIHIWEKENRLRAGRGLPAVPRPDQVDAETPAPEQQAAPQ
jgi:tetratricopeptide (TPR) repeat protein